jgi:hypothetical protein
MSVGEEHESFDKRSNGKSEEGVSKNEEVRQILPEIHSESKAL